MLRGKVGSIFLRGFTLAEVLITLGIIGVVAAMTMPTLITNIQERLNITALRTFYSTLSKATAIIVAEHDEPSSWGLRNNDAAISNEVFERYSEILRVQKVCVENDSSCFPFPIKSYVTGNPVITESQYRSWALKSFIMQNGMTVFIDVNNNCYSVFVDVNGFKKPNTFGIDVFALMINGKGRIVSFDDESIPNDGGNDNIEYNYAFRLIDNNWKKDY